MADQFVAQVIAAFGRRIEVRDEAGEVREARPFGRSLQIVCGDRVRCDVEGGEVHAIEVLPRRSALWRSSARGGAECAVANVSLLAVVVAPRPEADLFVVDRYLAAATSAAIEAIVVLNKSDLPTTPQLDAGLASLEALGYPIVRCGAESGAGIDALRARLAAHVGALVGQSGVGKSSLIAALVPGVRVPTGSLVRDEEGRHTTTASRMYDLPGGGQLVDSPGVRDFAPAVQALDPASLGFVEVASRAGDCRFADCRHMQEPGCAVQAGVASGVIDSRRYESYRRLRRLFEDLREAQGPGSRRSMRPRR
jgi:ribosome biogenesis GTPase